MASVLEPVREKSPLRTRVSPEEWRTRVDLAAAHRLAELQGWQEPYTIFNHLSARVPGEPDSMLIKPHDLLFGEITASNLVKVTINGKPVGCTKVVVSTQHRETNSKGKKYNSGMIR